MALIGRKAAVIGAVLYLAAAASSTVIRTQSPRGSPSGDSESKECSVEADCGSSRTCLDRKCVDPCVADNPCGLKGQCTAVEHRPVCKCPEDGCHVVLQKIDVSPVRKGIKECVLHTDCGEGNSCYEGKCKKPSDDTTQETKECILNAECKESESCINKKCQNPCKVNPCGEKAECTVSKHSPVCRCPKEFSGDPFVKCQPIEPSQASSNDDPCLLSPCGLKAACRAEGKHPVCLCPPGYTGNPLVMCKALDEGTRDTLESNPCSPTPCGPYSACRFIKSNAVCSCLPGYTGAPPNCKGNCVKNEECQDNQICVVGKCEDACPDVCGVKATCKVAKHVPSCSCPPNHFGDPYSLCKATNESRGVVNQCEPSPCGSNARCQIVKDLAKCSCPEGFYGDPFVFCKKSEAETESKSDSDQKTIPDFNPLVKMIYYLDVINPCAPSPCGPNSRCKVKDERATCSCLTGFDGTPPYCRPECMLHSECDLKKACIGGKCKDPCVGLCGTRAECTIFNHSPLCACPVGFSGDVFVSCNPLNADSASKGDSDQKTVSIPSSSPPRVDRIDLDPCYPSSPCGANSKCKVIDDRASCACIAGFIGSPPNCRPECTKNSECQERNACMNLKCADPCPGTCGTRAECTVFNHSPVCACPVGFSGDAFVSCNPLDADSASKGDSDQKTVSIPSSSPIQADQVKFNPCYPPPCGANSKCKVVDDRASCACIAGFIGSPPNCRPECTKNSECQESNACVNLKCVDPCPGTCGTQAECKVVKHSAICSCPVGFSGDAYFSCNPLNADSVSKGDSDQKNVSNPSNNPIQADQVTFNPCYPSPCGANSECKVIADRALCACIVGFIGSPPNCKAECTINSECQESNACINSKCVDPCPGSCGTQAECKVVQHSARCSCPEGFNGDPFVICKKTEADAGAKRDSEVPKTNSDTKIKCTSSADCDEKHACLGEVCSDPCQKTCGDNAKCEVLKHAPRCSCLEGFAGDPFISCKKIEENSGSKNVSDAKIDPNAKTNPSSESTLGKDCAKNEECDEKNACVKGKCVDPCVGLCGENSECLVIKQIPVCKCPPSRTGNPFSSCQLMLESDSKTSSLQKECAKNDDCQENNACIRGKCADPCPGTCGERAECSVVNHTPICTCLKGYTGNPFIACYMFLGGEGSKNESSLKVDSTKGECAENSDCQENNHCIKGKCADPCPGTCGERAECSVVKHAPVCSCLKGHTGNPFVACDKQPVEDSPKIEQSREKVPNTKS